MLFTRSMMCTPASVALSTGGTALPSSHPKLDVTLGSDQLAGMRDSTAVNGSGCDSVHALGSSKSTASMGADMTTAANRDHGPVFCSNARHSRPACARTGVGPVE